MRGYQCGLLLVVLLFLLYAVHLKTLIIIIIIIIIIIKTIFKEEAQLDLNQIFPGVLF